ncbi:MAG: outer membrane beta-barrel protein [Pseudobacter sp.]|uniref:outer membrane beta-barrel protein n=1 Tax=Pseudobacter sp. TaxID=2045420 RepID=UPI003F819153
MRPILFFLLFIIPPVIRSQTISGLSISGQVKDIQNEPVPGATVRLLLAADSTPVQSQAARVNGQFRLTGISPGRYLVSISATGMQPWYSRVILADSLPKNIELAPAILHPLVKKEMQEVVVTAKKPLVEHDLDKTIINVEAMVGAGTGNTLELLEKTPGVIVDANGEISLYGSGGVTVLIDGRRTWMSGQDLAAYLRSMPASMIEKFELITNPPARYEAQGGALINIRLKKKRVAGYAGSVSHNSSTGKYYRSYNSINLNYLHKKLNVFGNLGYNRYTDFGRSNETRVLFTDNGQVARSSAMQRGSTFKSDDLSARLGFDYQLSSKATLGMIFSAADRKRKENSWYESSSFSKSILPDSTGIGENATAGRWNQYTANVNFQYKFNEKGKELTADANLIRYDNLSDQQLENLVRQASGSTGGYDNFIYHLPHNTQVYTLAADYIHPMKDRMNISAGSKSSFVQTDHQSDYFALPDNKPVPDHSRSNHFIYNETIHSAYLSSRKDWRRFGLQLGIRWENTLTKGHQLGNTVVPASINKRNYHSFFPSLFTSYKLDSAGRHMLLLNYTRRINRPGYQQLNPFLIFQDQYTYNTGNPALRPSYSNRFELIWRYKQLLNTRFMFDQMTDGISGATYLKDNVQITTTDNFGKRRGIALMVSLTMQATKWWNFSFNPAIGHFMSQTKIQNQEIRLQGLTWRIQFVNQFRFGKTWSAELSCAYNAPIVDWQRQVRSRYWINPTLQKKVWKGKGTIKINMEDPFRAMAYREETKGLAQAYSYRNNINDTRRVGLSFSYNFGKDSFTRKRRYNDNAADEIKERAQ